ncbi:MAG: hypothetical protein FJ191_00165 [Gammaproteobacteria bacterium]|nr:hypothetical protein [Gammaproteobacteria bacterium]
MKPEQKRGNVAGSCISETPGQKRGDVRADCDPGIRGQKHGDVAASCISFREGSNVVDTFSGGVKLLATVRKGVLVGYSAVDRRGQALQVSVSRDSVPGVRPDPLARMEQRAQDHAQQRREAWERAMQEAESHREEKGCYLFIFDADGAPVGVSYGRCPKGVARTSK